MSWVGGLIAAGGALYEGLTGQKQQAAQYNDQAQFQRDLATMGIRMRVADAKEAGLHPLAALGAMPQTAAPITINPVSPGIAQAGQDISRALMAQQTPQQRAQQEAELEAVRASTERDRAQADYWRAQAQKIQSPGTGPGVANPDVVSTPVHRSKVEGVPLSYDHVKPKADEFISRRSEDKSLTAADHAAWQHRTLRDVPGGKSVILAAPEGSDWAESLGEMPWALRLEVIRKSAELSRMTVPEWLSHVTLGGDYRPFAGAERAIERSLRARKERTNPTPRYRGGSRSVYGPVD